MAIEKLTETDLLILDVIAKKQRLNQRDISLYTNTSESTVSRVVNRLENQHLIKKQRVYKDNEWFLNRNKSKEVLEVITLFEKCKSAILDESKSLINVHDIEINSSVFVPKNYDKSSIHVYYTAYRKAISLSFPQATVNIIIGEVDSINTAQISLRPFYLVVDTEMMFDESILNDLIQSEIMRLYQSVNDKLKDSKLYLRGIKNISGNRLAIQDDWIPLVAIKSGMKEMFYPTIDDSRKTGYGELEYSKENNYKILF